MTLGRFPALSLAEARQAWRNARELVARGNSPQARTNVDTFEAVAAEWIKRDQAGNRSVKEVRRVVDRYLLPSWSGRPFASIVRRDVFEVIDGIVDRGAVTLARRVHAHLHRLFRWAVGRGIIPVSPMDGMSKPGNAVRRDRVLSDAELAAVWQAAKATDWPYGPLFRLLILTGARRDEIGALRWPEIDGDTIRLKGERTKNGQPHDIPLSPEAAEVVASLPRMAGTDVVFASARGTPVNTYARAKTALDAATAELATVEVWRIHDLRRTVATGLQRLGFSLQVIEAVLGHVSGSRGGIVGVYQRHTFDAEKRAALEAWGRHVAALAGHGGGADVIELGSRR